MKEKGFIEKYLDEKPILPAKKLVPDSAKDLKKLAAGFYAQQIKAMSSQERAEFTGVLTKLMDILHKA
tara:strand:+ start:2347 stop:2550 length:204 start_codon:yes stop_codon:yes gene_type:complete